MERRSRILSCGLALSVLVSACGTTVPLVTETTVLEAPDGTVVGTGTLGTGDGTTLDTSASSSTTSSTTSTGTTTSRPAGSTSASGSGSTTTTASGSTTTSSGTTTGTTTGTAPAAGNGTAPATTSGGSPTTAPSEAAPPASSGSQGGAPLEPVQIGVAYVTGQEEGAAALGGEAREEYGSQRAMNEVLIEWMNANGGINGHPIEPVWTELEFVDNRPAPERAAAICAEWTQDNNVVAGIFLGPDGTELPRCLNDAGAAYYQWGWTLHTQQEYAQIPRMFQPAEFGVERLATTYADQLVAAGWFGDNPTPGLLVNDYAAAQKGWQVLKERLASHGITLDDANVYDIPAPESFDAIGASLQAIQNAQLRMRSSGVDHVMFLCWGCAAFFMLYADSQEWRPEGGYGMTSNDLLVGIVANDDFAATQLPGSMAVGYWPIMDQGVIGVEGAVTNATWDKCEGVLTPSGTVQTNNDYQNAVAFCSAYLFFDAAARASGSTEVTGETIRIGAEALGNSFQDGISLRTNLGPQRHSGVDLVRMLEFVPDCQCFEYFGNPISVP